MNINIEYVSMLAQAQKAVGIGAIDRIVGTVGQMAAVKPEALDKLNADEIIDEYSNMLGISPDLIIANDQVAVIREQRAAEQAQQQQLATLPEMAKTAKTLSEPRRATDRRSITWQSNSPNYEQLRSRYEKEKTG